MFFLDYFACGKLDVDRAANVIQGIATACEESGCALIGGETAEMPSMYPVGEYDLAGFAVGVVEKDELISGKDIVVGDVILGLASNGIHSNGYSLVRKIIERSNPALDEEFDNGKTLRQAIIAPTRLYVKPILSLMKKLKIKGMAHITGGGLTENIPRTLPENVVAQLDAKSWQMPKLFQWLQQEGQVETAEMYRTFNCGIGMVVIVSANDAQMAIRHLEDVGENVRIIGTIRARQSNEHQTQII